MNAAFVTAEPELVAALAKWYARHPSIRRLQAIENSVALSIFVTLEPTADGDDMLPIWLARSGDWQNDLRMLARREVQLALMFSEAPVASNNPEEVILAEVSWRDSWSAS